jgi:hypothetical protein
VLYSVKAVIKNKKIKDCKNPDDSSKALILAFFLYTGVSIIVMQHIKINA